MNHFKLTISSPDGNVFSGDVTDLFVRGSEGDLAVLAGHIPFITSLKPGVIRFTLADEALTENSAEIDGGLLTVGSDSVTLLCGQFKKNH